MKKRRLILSTVIVVSITGSALAFKTKAIGGGSIYCSNSGSCCTDRIDFRPDEMGAVQDPCGTGKTVYICTGVQCVALPSTTRFSETPLGK